MPHYTLLQGISAAGTMMPPTLVMPGLKSAEIEWCRLVLGRRVLAKSSPTAWVNGPLFAWWLDLLRLGSPVGIEQQRASHPSWQDGNGQPLPVLVTIDGAPSTRRFRPRSVCTAEDHRMTFPPHMTHVLQVIDVSRVMQIAFARPPSLA
jgi:hypothetical protein